jgi:F-type H+-transporting ATPase subunit gamma
MPTLRDIKTRIKGVQSTQQITKAMKLVAAAKLRRAQENIVNARPYARKISTMLGHLITEEDRANNPFIVPREVKKALVVVVTADRGLCGAFNSNLIKETIRYIDEELKPAGVEALLYCVGKKGYEFFSKRNYNICGNKSGIFGKLKYEVSLDISSYLISGYQKGDFDKVIIIYNEFKSVIQQKIVREEFLPVPSLDGGKAEHASMNYIYEPGHDGIIEFLLPKHLKAQVWRILLESFASENGAKMTAMDNATANASELIRTLTITFNKARQASITTEILEIVSGANALKSN